MDEPPPTAPEREQSHHPQALHIHNYPYGGHIVREGDNPPCFFVVLSGQIRLSRRTKVILHLKDQDIFGLEHLLLKRPCLYTATAMSEARVAAYGADALDHFIRHNPRMMQTILVSVLRQLERLAYSSAQGSESISLEDVRVDFYRDGEVIIQEGSVGTEFYRLVSTQGGLRVSIKGRQVALMSTPGEFFGEIAGLLHLPRQATVVSIGDSVVEKYDTLNLEAIILDHPEIALQVTRSLISRLIQVDVLLTDEDY